LQSGPAPDEIRGTAGDDILHNTAAGDQTLVGGAGADKFWFAGTGLTGTSNDHVADLNFAEGDTIAFAKFGAGTFAGIAGGNKLAVASGGTGTTLDSFADIAELDQASSAVTVTQEGSTDTLVLTVTDTSGAVQAVHIDHAWAAYQAALI